MNDGPVFILSTDQNTLSANGLDGHIEVKILQNEDGQFMRIFVPPPMIQSVCEGLELALDKALKRGAFRENPKAHLRPVK